MRKAVVWPLFFPGVALRLRRACSESFVFARLRIPVLAHFLREFTAVCRVKPYRRQDKKSGINPDRQTVSCLLILHARENMKKIDGITQRTLRLPPHRR